MQNETLSHAIHILNTTHAKLSDLLSDEFPNLKLKADNVLRVLINGFKVVNDQPIGDEPVATAGDFPPITKMFGKAIDFKLEPDRTPFTVSEDEIDAFKDAVDGAAVMFAEMSAKDILEHFDAMTIRAVGKSAGLEVTPTEPEMVTVSFIKIIQEALQAKQDLDEEVSKIKEGDRGIDTDNNEVEMPAHIPLDAAAVTNSTEVPLPDLPASTPEEQIVDEAVNTESDVQKEEDPAAHAKKEPAKKEQSKSDTKTKK